MQSVLVVLAIAFTCTLALDVTLNDQWKLWKNVNNKRYSDAEEQIRYELFILISIY
jgi:hypothetical protein